MLVVFVEVGGDVMFNDNCCELCGKFGMVVVMLNILVVVVSVNCVCGGEVLI